MPNRGFDQGNMIGGPTFPLFIYGLGVPHLCGAPHRWGNSSTPNCDGLRLLAVNEVTIHKGHTYLTTALDFETGGIVWAGKGRSEATLMGFFNELSPEQRDKVEAVASDMACGFRNAVQWACPRAALVYDLFHVVRSTPDKSLTSSARPRRRSRTRRDGS